MEKPIQRSNFRRTLGSCYFQLKRHLQWRFSNRKWARAYADQPLEVLVFRHETPLFRKLKDVDMWMQHNKVNNLQIAAKKPEYTYKVYEKDHWITQEYWGDYVRHNTIYRKVYNSQGELVDDQYITENHSIMMYQPLLESGQSS